MSLRELRNWGAAKLNSVGRKTGNRLRDLSGQSNAGKWTRSYEAIAGPVGGGDETTYRLAAAFLKDVRLVEDWGCGLGGFRPFCETAYVGIDGSSAPTVDRIADLETYRSDAEGILLRHVLEHNYRWASVLDNALSSFTKKMCLVLFTPFADVTREIGYNHTIGVPDLSFERSDIVSRFGDLAWTSQENIPTRTQYRLEHVFYLSK